MAMQHTLLQILIVALAVYVLFGIYLYLNQRNVIYIPNDRLFEDCPAFIDYEQISHRGTRFYYRQGSSGRAVVYYHGNANSACDRGYTREVFEKTDHAIIYVEYAGYAGDDQKPSSDLIKMDAEHVHDFLLDQGLTHNMIYGQSIGSGPASYHASLGGVDHVILVSPFSTLQELAQSKYKLYPASILLREEYNNKEWLSTFEGKVTILHGENDTIIPRRFSKMLYAALKTTERAYHLIPGRRHNNLWTSALFKDTLLAALQDD